MKKKCKLKREIINLTHILNYIYYCDRTLLRRTQTSQLESISEAGSTRFYLGQKGKDFEFTDLSSRVEFAASSAQTEDLDNLNKWLQVVA